MSVGRVRGPGVREREQETTDEVRLASIPRRLLAACLDVGILMAALLWLGSAHRNAGLRSGLPNEALWFYPVAGVLIVLAYQFIFLAGLRCTPGMVFLGISITDSAGDRAGVGQVVVRILVSILSAGALGLGYVWALFHRRNQTWHDMAADTIVIRGLPQASRRSTRLPPRRAGPRTYRLS